MNKPDSGTGKAWLFPVLSISAVSTLLIAIVMYLMLAGTLADKAYKENAMALDHLETLCAAAGTPEEAISRLPYYSEMRVFSLDVNTGAVTASTHQFYVGKDISWLKIDTQPFYDSSARFRATIHGEKLYISSRRIGGEAVAAVTASSAVDGNALLITIIMSAVAFALSMGIGYLLTTVTAKYSNEHREARTDAPTKLLNRRAYAEDVLKLKSSKRLRLLRYVSLDLNGLKEANDTLGHEAGDELIKNTARFMTTAFGHLGKLYRTGGDEFVALLLCDRAEFDEALGIFNEGVDLWKSVRGRPFSVSVGEASKEEFPDYSIDELAKRADERMYEAKDAYYRKTGKTRRK